jgi:hypothetical protein
MKVIQIIYKNKGVWVSFEWLKQYYARPDIQAKRNAWKVEEGYVCYRSILNSLASSKNSKKLSELPSYQALLDKCKVKPKAKTKIANKNAQRVQNWHQSILNELYQNSMPIYNPTYIHRLYRDIVDNTISALLSAKKIKPTSEAYYIAIQDIINTSTGEVIIQANSKVYPPVSIRTVERYFQNRKVQAVFDGKRLGSEKKYSTYTPTSGVKSKHLIWGMDGYTNNFYLNNTFKTCVTYVIIDLFDNEILGIATGMQEDTALQLEAWKQAIEYSGHFPREVEVDGKNVMDYITDVVDIKRLSRKNKQGYAIEHFFALAQNSEWRNKQGYRGENITAKRKGARMNSDIKADNPELYPHITMAQIHNAWIEFAEKTRKNIDRTAPIAGKKAEKHEIARLFGDKSVNTIDRGFINIKRKKFEVPAELHLHSLMPNDWRVETAIYDGECHIYNQGVYIATLKETVRPSRSTIENAEKQAIGHHIKRSDELEKLLEVNAEAMTAAIPDEAQAILDAAKSPAYWTKVTERKLDKALSESLSDSAENKKSRKKFFSADDLDLNNLETIKTA